VRVTNAAQSHPPNGQSQHYREFGCKQQANICHHLTAIETPCASRSAL
jgi:hypothetical protein